MKNVNGNETPGLESVLPGSYKGGMTRDANNREAKVAICIAGDGGCADLPCGPGGLYKAGTAGRARAGAGDPAGHPEGLSALRCSAEQPVPDPDKKKGSQDLSLEGIKKKRGDLKERIRLSKKAENEQIAEQMGIKTIKLRRLQCIKT